MPELPEVEVITRGLQPHLKNRRILDITWSGKDLRSPIPFKKMRNVLPGAQIEAVRRRAKYIEIALDTGMLMIVHLGMTGNLGIFKDTAHLVKHDHVEWMLDDGNSLRYNDVRRFGSIRLLSAREAVSREKTIYATTGPEPLKDIFNGDYLFKRCCERNIPIKTLIMDGSTVAGVGNIYANESLFQAGIHPHKRTQTLSLQQCHRLTAIIKEVLTNAIACGGSTINDFRNASQESGYFQMNFLIYGKRGEPCKKCGSTIEKIKTSGRASFFCPNCQINT